jgi:hypothetical protein
VQEEGVDLGEGCCGHGWLGIVVMMSGLKYILKSSCGS